MEEKRQEQEFLSQAHVLKEQKQESTWAEEERNPPQPRSLDPLPGRGLIENVEVTFGDLTLLDFSLLLGQSLLLPK